MLTWSTCTKLGSILSVLLMNIHFVSLCKPLELIHSGLSTWVEPTLHRSIWQHAVDSGFVPLLPGIIIITLALCPWVMCKETAERQKKMMAYHASNTKLYKGWWARASQPSRANGAKFCMYSYTHICILSFLPSFGLLGPPFWSFRPLWATSTSQMARPCFELHAKMATGYLTD